MDENYVLIRWPESQSFMEADWFEQEAILALGHEHITGDSAYFIPESRLLNNDFIINRCSELAINLVETEDDIKLLESGYELWDLTPYESLLNLKLNLM